MSYNSPFTGNVVQPTDVSYRAFTLTVDTTLSWPINGNATDNYAARIMEVTAASAGLKLAMPPANQASVGQDALIRNVGSNSFTVTDYNGSTIISINAGIAEYIYITANATTAGVWGIIAFGTGTSSADASTLAGYGLTAIGATLNQSHPSSSFAAGYTFSAVDRSSAKIWSSGAGSATLPSAASLDTSWFTLVKNSGNGTLTVNCSGSELIDGASYKAYNPNESSFIINTGTGYVTVGYGVSTNFAFGALVKPVTTGSYTLTFSEAQNLIQEYIGTLTGNVTIVFPSVVGLYVVANKTTAGGYTLTLTTGLGSTAVIPSGQQATVACDGANFFNANTVQAGASTVSISNGTVSNPAVAFSLESNTGIYRSGIGQFGISVLGALKFYASTAGVTSPGTGTFIGGVSGGTF